MTTAASKKRFAVHCLGAAKRPSINRMGDKTENGRALRRHPPPRGRLSYSVYRNPGYSLAFCRSTEAD